MKKQEKNKEKNKEKTREKISKIGITPLGSRVVLEPLEREEGEKKLSSGIYIPESAREERPEQGKIVAVGGGDVDGGELVPMRVKVGDTVIFSKYGYDEVKMDGKKYFIIKEENILAVVKN